MNRGQGETVWSYHALNLLIHLAAGLTLFGLLRRTLARQVVGERVRAAASPLALAVALLCVVHTLQTESVIYTAQRAESLMGLFYLLTLYSFARGLESGRRRLWFAAAVGTCLLGMACKEVMVSAPLLVLLYDRTFVAGTFSTALRRRGWWYGGLGASWLLLAYLVVGGGGRAGTVGFTAHATPWSYGLMQCRAVAQYVRLALWPQPLVFDYGTELDARLAEV